MSSNDEQRSNERRRQQAAEIIAAQQKRKRLAETDEMLLDQEALRQAAIRAGLKKTEAR